MENHSLIFGANKKPSPSLHQHSEVVKSMEDANVSRNGSRRVVFSPDVYKTPTVVLQRSGTADRVVAAGLRQKRAPGSFTCRLCKNAGYLPVRLFRYVGANVVRALCFFSCRRGTSSKVSPKTTFSRQFAPPRESHHAEAVEDCIKFINSSSRRSC